MDDRQPPSNAEIPFTSAWGFATLAHMLKKILPVFLMPLVVAGCSSVITNLTPLQQTRSTNDLYRVEAALASRQQTLRWDSISPQIVVGKDTYPMKPTLMMSNRWEGLVPVPAGTTAIRYHFKFDFKYNAMGGPMPDSSVSAEYTLRILPP
jgi:hypothetical protein